MGKNLLLLSQKTPASSSDAARELLRNFAALIGLSTGKNFVPDPELFNVWASALRDLSPIQIHAAGERLMKIWRYPNLPMPGDVRAQIDDAENKGLDLEVANEWEKVLDGIHWSAPRRFSPATEHAIRAAGGIHFIERCSESELVWCRKTFVASYKNVHQTGAAEHLLGNGAAKHILAQLRAGPLIERKQLPREEGPSQPPSRDEVRAVLDGVIVERPAAPQESEEELIRRWAAQKKRVLERAAELGIEAAQNSPAEPQGKLLKTRDGNFPEAVAQNKIVVGR